MMKRAGLIVALALLITLVTRSSCQAADWTHWRGPLQTGVSPEQDLPDTFSPETVGKDNLIWKAPYGCRSTPLILNGRVYFINSFNSQDKDLTQQERVMCLDEKTGKKLWEHIFNVFFTDIVTVRLGWTVLAADTETGNIYAHGTQGFLYCFDRNGKILWQKQLTEEFGRVSGYGGRVTSPVVDGNLVIVGLAKASWGKYGRGGNRFIAFDKKTGEVVWLSSTPRRVNNTYYSVPVVAVIGGERLLISGGGDGGVHALQVRTGKRVWSHYFAAGGVNPSPVVEGNLVWIAHGEDNPDGGLQGRVVCLDASQVKDDEPKLVWQVDGLKIKYASPLLYDGRLYLAEDTAKLHCLYAKTGKPAWRRPYNYGRNAKGSPVWADGKIYITDVNARFHILKPGPTRATSLHTQFFRAPTPGGGVELNGSPGVANGRVFLSTSEEFYCIGKPGHNKQPIKLPTQPKEEAVARDAKPAQLLVVPGEVALKPGKSVQFKALLYDDKGRFLRESKAEWELAGMQAPEATIGLPPPPRINPPPLKGQLTAEGKLTVPANLQGQFGNVVAKAAGLTARGRVRQTCRLPYNQDFEKVPVGAIPGGWVNTQGKFAVRKVGDSNVLVKTATNASPLVARADGFLGLPEMSDYTIEADIMGQKFGGDLPEVGITAQRYTLWLWGNTQQLRLTSWDALPRVDKTIGFTFKPGTWYRMKLTTGKEGGNFVVRGKIWERGTAEPSGWTLQVTDPIPNTEGSPALYARATGIVPGKGGAEAFFDNVVVTPNK